MLKLFVRGDNDDSYVAVDYDPSIVRVTESASLTAQRRVERNVVSNEDAV